MIHSAGASSGESDVTTLTPVRTPRVLDLPIGVRVSDEGHCVVEISGAAGAISRSHNTSSVVLPVLVRVNCHSQGLFLEGSNNGGIITGID